jgi:hypothetical protein
VRAARCSSAALNATQRDDVLEGFHRDGTFELFAERAGERAELFVPRLRSVVRPSLSMRAFRVRRGVVVNAGVRAPRPLVAVFLVMVGFGHG